MSTLESLLTRAKRLSKAENQHPPAERETPPLHLLTEQEQGHLQAFLLLIPDGHDLHQLTDQQLERLEQWALLLEALKNEDEQAISQYRQLLQEAAWLALIHS